MSRSGRDCGGELRRRGRGVGATYTSHGIINAVKDALASAGGGDGSLTGTADGFIGPITVSVTMDGDKIAAVEVLSNSETIEIAGTALEQIPAAIVEANSPDVDVVSGATYEQRHNQCGSRMPLARARDGRSRR